MKFVRVKLFVYFLLALLFIVGCTKSESEPKPDQQEQAKLVATEFKEKQYTIEYEEIADLKFMERLQFHEDKIKPLLTKEAFETNVMVNNLSETVNVSIATKGNLSFKNIEFEFKEKTENTYIFDYKVKVLFEKHNDEELNATESITGEMKVTNTDDGWLVSSSTQTHFPQEHIKSIQKKFGVPVGLH